jgi:hypothetical protein
MLKKRRYSLTMSTDHTKYRYVRFGRELPVRVAVSPVTGGALGTEAPDPVTGELRISKHSVRLDRADDAWDIDEAEFDRLLAAYREKVRKRADRTD